MNRIEKKISKVFNNIPVADRPEAVFIFNDGRIDKNFFYITGLYNGIFENCGLLGDSNGKIYLLTTALEEEAARSVEKYAEIVIYKNKKQRNDGLKRVFSNYSKIGIIYNFISYSFYLYLKETFSDNDWVDIGKAFKVSRMIKSQDEIDIISRASDFVSTVADSIPGILREGITELDLAAEIDYRLKKEGAHGIAFKTIAAFGKNTSMPHYSSAGISLKKGDAVLVDFGAEYMGYSSDITRTYLAGEHEKNLLKIYDTVYNAQKRAIELIRAGVNTEYVEKEVRYVIDRYEQYRGRFIHSLGHSIGLDVHDDGYPSEDFNKEFAESMVLTVEPGIYIPGLYGVRLEDDIVVKKDECRVLTTAKKESLAYEIQ
ncbi:putative peptidase [subsurface metagenome]